MPFSQQNNVQSVTLFTVNWLFCLSPHHGSSIMGNTISAIIMSSLVPKSVEILPEAPTPFPT